jgi:hypothetical protein
MPDTNPDFEKMPVPDALKQLGVDPKTGLSADVARQRLAQYGPNALAQKAMALRGGQWGEADATTLVPGDIVRIRLGDVVPANATLIEGDYHSSFPARRELLHAN